MAAPWHRNQRSAQGVRSLTRRHAPVDPGTQVWTLDDDDGVNANANANVNDASQALDGGMTKGHKHAYTENALDKLENWFGLKHEPQSGPSQRRVSAQAQAAPPARPVPRSASSTVQVIVHSVAATDTLERIALQYGADANTLRRSNRLWPGDAVQMREQLYIPVESCRWQPPDATIAAVERKPDGSLHTLREASVKQVDAETLRFFPGDRARPTRGIPSGDAGASGIEDLIQLQHMRRNRGGTQPQPPTHIPSPPKRIEEPSDPSWRPNLRTLGPKKRPPPKTQVSLLDTDDVPREERQASPPPTITDAFSSRRLDELLRGPPVNPGAANWMRPIHESLPEQVPRQAASSGNLWSDLMSGRVSIEDAFHVAMDELRTATTPRARTKTDRGPFLPM